MSSCSQLFVWNLQKLRGDGWFHLSNLTLVNIGMFRGGGLLEKNKILHFSIVAVVTWAIFLQSFWLEMLTDILPYNNSFRIKLMLQYLATGWMESLCNFSERVGSQHYTRLHQRTSFQHITPLWCHCYCLWSAPNRTKFQHNLALTVCMDAK